MLELTSRIYRPYEILWSSLGLARCFKKADPISLDEAGPKPVDNLGDRRDEIKSFMGVHRLDYGLELEMFSCTVLVTSQADQEE
jgi:hypothetical protein